jgi:methyltransferase-like protein/SAM-dependent methyltransferase
MSETAPDPASSYDDTPYDSFSYPQSHPNRVAAVAKLFGMEPQPVARWRILELGCASGGNLLPIADAWPDTRCLGIDLSQRQIADGAEAVRHAGATNIELRNAGILDVNRDWGEFDYVLCHGVFSWVPLEVRERIFAICRENLAPHGIAYISYNTSPGWRMRGMLRDMMCYHARRFKASHKRVEQARALIDFVARAVPDKKSAYGVLLARELELLREKSDTYLLHEFLEEHNEPLYFHDFIEGAAAHQLQYLGEARLATMAAANFPPEVQETLARIATDIVQQEQFMDFIRNRQFRETLLCHAGIPVNRTLAPAAIADFHVAAPIEPPSAAVDCTNDEPAEFSLPNGRRLSSSGRLAKSAYLLLGEQWPQNIAVSDLAHKAAERAFTESERDPQKMAQAQSAVAERLLKLAIRSDLPLIEAAQTPCVRTVSDAPRASPLARYQATCQTWAASRRHEVVRLDKEERFLLSQLDGTRARPALLTSLAEHGFHADSGRLELLLQRFARTALLIG